MDELNIIKTRLAATEIVLKAALHAMNANLPGAGVKEIMSDTINKSSNNYVILGDAPDPAKTEAREYLKSYAMGILNDGIK